MTTIVSFIVVIGLLILIHELGHFFVARWTGVGVERFSIGFGPVLLRWKGKETEYCLSVIPMGGYVKMMGEEDNPLEGGGGMPYDPRKAFAKKPLWARFLIVFAGPGMMTPEGIGLGSTAQAVKKAYPDGSLNLGYWVVPLPGGSEYQFQLGQDGPVVEMLLALPDQDCFG